jgi:putative cell wall-binding protein
MSIETDSAAWAHLTDLPIAFSRAVAADVRQSETLTSPYTMVGLTWEGRSPEHAWFRTRVGRQGWGPWHEFNLAIEEGPDPGTAEFEVQRSGSTPVWTGPQNQIEVRVQGGAPEDVRIALIDTTDRTKPFLRKLSDRFTSAVPKAGAAEPSRPSIRSRAAWDPAGTCVPAEPPEYIQVTHAVIHHTDTSNAYSQADVPGQILGICLFHTRTREWNDIGYNLLVDRFGTIWEGRTGGVDKGVSGAHAMGFNSYSTGIALMGNFTTATPLPAMQDSLIDLLAWKLSVHNLDPLGSTTVISKGSPKWPQGTPVTLATINGHRDTQVTACPGNACYSLLGSFRAAVAARWTPIPLDTYRSPLVGRFDGDTVEDGAVLQAATGTWWVTTASSPPRTWGTLTPTTGWTNHLIGDFNGDGRDDIANYHTTTATWHISTSTGTALTTTAWGTLTPTTGWTNHLIGDFNGDGRDDIANYHTTTATWHISTSTGTALPAGLSAVTSTYDHWSTAFVTDIDADGHDDLLQLDAYDGSWHRGRVEGDTFVFSQLEDSPYRTTVVRNGERRAAGSFLSYFGQEFTWLRTEVGYGLGEGDATDVTRLAGDTRYGTAATISAASFAPGVPVAYVATGDNFPDALAAGPAAIQAGGPVLLTRSSSVPAETITELQRLRPASIVVVGGPAVVSNNVMSQLDGLTGGPVMRIAGIDRYSTAAAVARASFPGGATRAYVAVGNSFPDALVGTPAAGVDDAPILLVTSSGIPAATRQELERLQPDQVIILGGAGVIGNAVASSLANLTGATVTRLSGADRYATAAAVSRETFEPAAPSVYIATGANFPDALAGGPVAGRAGVPLLLISSGGIPGPTAAELLRLKPELIILLGGEGIISDDVAGSLAVYSTYGADTQPMFSLPRP